MKINVKINYQRLLDWSSLKASDFTQLSEKIELLDDLLSDDSNPLIICNQKKFFDYRLFREMTISDLLGDENLSDRSKLLLKLIPRKISKYNLHFSCQDNIDEEVLNRLKSLDEKIYSFSSQDMIEYYGTLNKLQEPVILLSFSNHNGNPACIMNYKNVEFESFDREYIDKYWCRVYNARNEIQKKVKKCRCDVNDNSAFPHIHFEGKNDKNKEALNLIDIHFLHIDDKKTLRLWKHHTKYVLKEDVISILKDNNLMIDS